VVSMLGRQIAVNRLQMVDQFAGFTREQLRDIGRLAERVQVDKGEILTREGRIGRDFFLILAGRVGVTQQGRRVKTLGPGDCFGEFAAPSPRSHDATVTALSELDVLIIGPRELGAMAGIPGFRDVLHECTARKLRTVEARREEGPRCDVDPDRVR
jgi:CRP-like cAMP-binding protein